MLTRRQLRVKVMQSLYSYYQNKDIELSIAKQTLILNMHSLHDLYIYIFSILIELQEFAKKTAASKKKKLLPSQTLNLHANFVENKFLKLLSKNPQFRKYRKDYNRNVDKLIKWLFSDLEKLDFYTSYLKVSNLSFNDYKKFILKLFNVFIASNSKLHQHFENTYIHWTEDIPIANLLVLKTLKGLKENTIRTHKLGPLFKNKDDRTFAIQLFSYTLVNDLDYTRLIMNKAKNWKIDRIALLDIILMKMALAEIVGFKEIPVKVSFNEYIDISKEYSTPRSKMFINGILDKIVFDLSQKNKIKKVGRGLL